MIDAPVVLRSFLLAQEPLTDKVDERIWGGRINPIEGYLPSQGPAIVFRPRGSGTIDYSSQILTLAWVFKSYGEDEDEAREIDRILFDVLHDAKTGGMYGAFLSVPGQPSQEPTLHWYYSLSYWTTLMQTYFEVTP